MPSINYIVTNPDGLLVRAQMDTKNPANIKRKMSNGEGFAIYKTFVRNGNQVWGQVSNNPGDLQQEYACLSIGNRHFAEVDGTQDPSDVPSLNPAWIMQIDSWARGLGFKGVPPF